MDEIKEPTLKEKVDTIYGMIDSSKKDNVKIKKIKIPRRAKVRKGKLKKGWIGVLRIDENGNISGEKQKIEGSVFREKEGIYHATNGKEILFWQGKFPIVIQESKSINPIIFNNGENQTYGQKYIMARMLSDTIKMKKGGGAMIIWILVIGVIVFGAGKLLHIF
jgi:hypothetical protein